MATVKKCDRCGETYDTPHARFLPFRVKKIRYTIFREAYRDDVDLCADCLKKLKRFVEGVELEEVDSNGNG